MFTKEFLAPFLTLFGEYDRFGLAHRIKDHSLLVQTIHGIPVVSFPCKSAVMDCQEEKCEHHLVDFVFVIFHEIMLAFRSPSFNRGYKLKTPNKSLRATCDGVSSSAIAIVTNRQPIDRLDFAQKHRFIGPSI